MSKWDYRGFQGNHGKQKNSSIHSMLSYRHCVYNPTLARLKDLLELKTSDVDCIHATVAWFIYNLTLVFFLLLPIVFRLQSNHINQIIIKVVLICEDYLDKQNVQGLKTFVYIIFYYNNPKAKWRNPICLFVFCFCCFFVVFLREPV